MSSAKIFTSDTNVRTATATEKTKTVYKNVLGSPFILKWPTIHTDLGQTILSQLIKTLEPVGEYRKKCRASKKEKKTLPSPPDIGQRLHVGINEVTRYLETVIATRAQRDNNVMYICKREIKPLQLCEHLLYMSALAKIKVVPMPTDSECKLGKSLGITRASVILIEILENKEESLRLSAKDIPLIDAPWLTNALDQQVHFVHDNVKILKTVAPIRAPKKQQKVLKRKAEEDDQPANNKKVKN